MAISKNVLLSAGLAIFGTALVLATGPYGLAFGAAMLYSALIALALTAIIYGASTGNMGVRSSVPKFTPTPLVIITPAPVVHSRGFVPANNPPVVHTQQFVPAPARTAAPVSHSRHFEPAAQTRTAAPVSHSRHFVPAAGVSSPGFTPGFAAATTTTTRLPSASHPPGAKISSVFVPRGH